MKYFYTAIKKIIFIFLVILFSSAGFAQVAERESNNTFETADTINIRSVKTGSVNSRYINSQEQVDGDDYFRTAFPEDGTLKIYVQATNNSGNSDVTLNFRIYDRYKSLPIFERTYKGAAGATVYDTITYYGLAAETFYFQFNPVGAFSNFTTTPSIWSYSFSYDIIDTSENDIEPNNTFEQALNINQQEEKKGHIGYLKAVGSSAAQLDRDDNDYYKTNLAKDGTLKIYVKATNRGGTAATLGVAGYDRLKITEFDRRIKGAAGATVFDTITLYGRAADTYYFRFHPVDSVSNFSSIPAVWSYSFSYDIIDTSENDIEPNNTFEQALNINQQEEKKGHIGYYKTTGNSNDNRERDNNDYYKTNLAKDGTLKIYVKATNRGGTSATLGVTGYNRQKNTEFERNIKGAAGATVYDTITLNGRAADSFYFRFHPVDSFSNFSSIRAIWSYSFSYDIINPTVNLSVSSNTGSEAGTTSITVTATASQAVSGNQTVSLGVSGTNITTGDYTLSNPTITILSGQTTGSVTFTVVDDAVVEGTETATLTISNPSGGITLGSTTTQNVTITDNDFPTVNLSVSSNTGSEAAASAITVTATASQAVSGNQTVSLGVSGTNITAGDYTLSNTTITIPGGQTTGSVTFTVVDDAVVEGTETATLTISNPSSGIMLGSTVTQNVTISDNDFPAVNLSVSSNTGSEAATTSITVTATASQAVSGNQTVSLGVSGTNITSGDYTLNNTTITIPGGQTTGSVTFTIIDDAVVEGTETATLTISNPSSGITLGSTTTQNITITDNDVAPNPTVNLSVSSNTGSEAAATSITVTATASQAVSGNQTVSLGVSGTNITAGDYTLSNPTITILSGQTTGSVTFTIIDDAVVEGTETATLTISNPSSGITLGSTTTQNITITDNDVSNRNPPVITSNGGGATATISMPENTTYVTTVQATDPDVNGSPAYSITGGADRTKFTISSTTGDLRFITAPDFEAPTDADGNNTYIVNVRAQDQDGLFDDQLITITVTDVMESAKPNLGRDTSITVACPGGTADIRGLYNTSGYSSVTYSTPDPANAPVGQHTLIVSNSSGLKDTAVIMVRDAPPTTVATMSNTKTAGRECTGSDGWTNYYNDNGTPSDNSDDIKLLSIKKNGNNIGSMGDGTFRLRVVATSGAGSGRAAKPNSPFVPNGTTFYSMNRYWDVTPTQQPTTPVDIIFFFNTQDLNDINGDYPGGNISPTQLQMYKVEGGNPDPTSNWSGATGVRYYQHGSNPGTSTWMYTNLGNNRHQAHFQVANFSGGGAGASAFNSLPVNLIKFDVVAEKDKVKVEWKTSTEINSKEYQVERSLDGRNFEKIATVAAAGNSTTERNYLYNDVKAMEFKGQTVYYRLLQSDMNGENKYTVIKNVRIGNAVNNLRLVYNPVQLEAILKYQSMERGKVTIRVFDQSGKVVVLKEVAVQKGDNQIKIATAHLAKGIYELQLISSKDNKHVRMMKE